MLKGKHTHANTHTHTYTHTHTHTHTRTHTHTQSEGTCIQTQKHIGTHTRHYHDVIHSTSLLDKESSPNVTVVLLKQCWTGAMKQCSSLLEVVEFFNKFPVIYRTRAFVNPLTPKDPYSGRTAPLTSKRCILYIYSTNIGTKSFKHGIYCPFFFSSKCSLFHNSNVFASCIINILCTGCAQIKKKIIPAPKV